MLKRFPSLKIKGQLREENPHQGTVHDGYNTLPEIKYLILRIVINVLLRYFLVGITVALERGKRFFPGNGKR